MSNMKTSRRTFIGSAAGLVAMGLTDRSALLHAAEARDAARQISCNVYPWITFFRREGREWADDLDRGLAEFARSGIPLFEPSVRSSEEVAALAPLLAKHGLRMESVYVNSSLHEDGPAAESIAGVLSIVDAARELGVRIIITNPAPLRIADGVRPAKTDAQLEIQARNLDRLGAEVRARGLTLAYHNHDPEMQNAAREFHHMMLATDPDHVALCLEAHWLFRGSGNSQVALFDIVELYGRRAVAVHLRQSRDGVWTEVFGPGDIDYPRLAAALERLGTEPLLVLEQPVEEGTPETLDAVAAHAAGLRYAAQVFGLTA